MTTLGLEKLAHPSLAMYAARLDQIVEQDSLPLIHLFPELGAALIAQLPGLVSRDQMFAHNTQTDPEYLRGLMRIEGREVWDDLTQTLWRGERVNGLTSLEGADHLVFASIYLAMKQVGGLAVPRLARLEVAAGAAALRGMRQIWPHFDHVAAIDATVKKNWELNYPLRVLQAPVTWSAPKMKDHYLRYSKPGLRRLRKAFFPEGKLPRAVADDLNEMREDPTAEYVGRKDFVPAYLALLKHIPQDMGVR